MPGTSRFGRCPSARQAGSPAHRMTIGDLARVRPSPWSTPPPARAPAHCSSGAAVRSVPRPAFAPRASGRPKSHLGLAQETSGTESSLCQHGARIMDSCRVEVNPKPGPGRTRHLLQRPRRRVHAAALQSGDHRLGRRHALGQLGLGQACARSGLDTCPPAAPARRLRADSRSTPRRSDRPLGHRPCLPEFVKRHGRAKLCLPGVDACAPRTPTVSTCRTAVVRTVSNGERPECWPELQTFSNPVNVAPQR